MRLRQDSGRSVEFAARAASAGSLALSWVTRPRPRLFRRDEADRILALDGETFAQVINDPDRFEGGPDPRVDLALRCLKLGESGAEPREIYRALAMDPRFKVPAACFYLATRLEAGATPTDTVREFLGLGPHIRSAPTREDFAGVGTFGQRLIALGRTRVRSDTWRFGVGIYALWRRSTWAMPLLLADAGRTTYVLRGTFGHLAVISPSGLLTGKDPLPWPLTPSRFVFPMPDSIRTRGIETRKAGGAKPRSLSGLGNRHS